MANKHIDILNDNELTIKNAKKVYFAVQRYCDAINNCDECIFNVCIGEELSKLYEIYLKGVSKLFNIECNKPFKVKHIAHDNKVVRENLEKLDFVLYEDEGVFAGNCSFDEVLDYLLSGKYTVKGNEELDNSEL